MKGEPDDSGLRRVRVGDRMLAAQVLGSGPAVLLESGAGGGGIGLAWHGVERRIAAFATSIVYDRAGTGSSDGVASNPTTADRARDLAGLLDALEVGGKVVLVGWSLGGLIVQHFAALHRARVAGIVLVDPSPDDTFSSAPAWQRRLMRSALPSRLFIALARRGWLRRPWFQRQLARMLESQLGPRFDRSQLPRLLELVAGPRLHEVTLMESARLEESCAQVQALLRAPGLPRCPLIVLSAGHGRTAASPIHQRIVESHRRTAARVPGGELRVLEDVGHHVPFEAPGAIVDAVRDVLQRAGA